jgi:hypothetical protein
MRLCAPSCLCVKFLAIENCFASCFAYIILISRKGAKERKGAEKKD